MFGGKWGKANHSSEGTLPRDAEAAVLVGRSLQGIAREWNTNGVRTVRDNTWSDGASRGAVQRSQRGHPPVSRPRGHRGYLGPPSWTATFTRARAILTDPARVHRPRHAYGPRFLLTGLALCGVCGKPLGSTTNHRRPVYTCRHCQEVSRCVQAVDDWVIGKVVERLSQSDPPSR